jgi:hypothetical protein
VCRRRFLVWLGAHLLYTLGQEKQPIPGLARCRARDDGENTKELTMRSLIVAGVFLTMSLGLVMAETFNGQIVEIKGNKLTVIKGKKKDVEGKEVTLTVDAKVKVSKGKFNPDTKKVEATDAIPEGIKSDLLVKGKNISITTDDTSGNVTAIILGGKGGKKKE